MITNVMIKTLGGTLYDTDIILEVLEVKEWRSHQPSQGAPSLVWLTLKVVNSSSLFRTKSASDRHIRLQARHIHVSDEGVLPPPPRPHDNRCEKLLLFSLLLCQNTTSHGNPDIDIMQDVPLMYTVISCQILSIVHGYVNK